MIQSNQTASYYNVVKELDHIAANSRAGVRLDGACGMANEKPFGIDSFLLLISTTK
jgi:hypothetical protein